MKKRTVSRCKCVVTGEIGTTDTFIKVGNKYYKNQEVYEADRKRKAEWKELIDYVCREFLGYEKDQPFSTLLPKKIQELSFYEYGVILETFKKCSSEIKYQFEHKYFKNESNKISYMFAIVKNSLADVNDEINRKRKQEEFQKPIIMESNDLSNVGSTKQGKDISSFLNDDEL